MNREMKQAAKAVREMFGIPDSNVLHAVNHLVLPVKPRRKLLAKCEKAGWLQLTWDDSVACDITAEEIEDLEA